MAPDDAGQGDHKPVQGPQQETLDGMSVLVGTQADTVRRVGCADKEKDTQGEAPGQPGQESDHAVAEFLAVAVDPAAEEQDQPHQIYRKTPGELNQVEQCPGPAGGGSRPAAFRVFHMVLPLSFRTALGERAKSEPERCRSGSEEWRIE